MLESIDRKCRRNLSSACSSAGLSGPPTERVRQSKGGAKTWTSWKGRSPGRVLFSRRAGRTPFGSVVGSAPFMTSGAKAALNRRRATIGVARGIRRGPPSLRDEENRDFRTVNP